MTVPTEEVQKAHLAELGVSGLTQYSGVVHEEFLKELQGQKGIEKYKEMWLNSPIVGAMVRAISMLTRQVEWTFHAEEDAIAAANKEFVEGAWADTSTSPEDFLAESVSGVIVFGWQYDEIVYKVRRGQVSGKPGESSVFTDGKIGWRKFASRSQDTLLRWIFDRTGGVRGMAQLAPPDFNEVLIPIEKALLFRHEMYKNNPEGLSMLRNSYRPWYFAKKIEEIEGIGIERDMAGLPVIEHPAELSHPSASSEQAAVYNTLKKLVRNIKRDEQMGVTLPQDYDENSNPMYKLSLLSTGGRRQIDTGQVLNRYYAQIAMTLLADWLVLGHEGVGSFALSSDKTEMFAISLGSLLDSVAEVINRHAIPRLLRLNGMDETKAPTLVHGDIETQDIQQVADGLQKLANAGMPMFPDERLEAWIRAQFGMPKIDPDVREEMLREREEQKELQRQAMTERQEANNDKTE